MIPTLNVTSNIREASARFAVLRRGVEDAATVSALNRTGTTVRAAASREIRNEYKLSAASVREQLKVIRASRSNLEVRVRATGRRIGLIDFNARQTRQGVTVQIKTGGGRKLIRSAFLATMKSGHLGVFSRGRYAGGKFVPGRSRLPITELTSLSLPKAFSNQKVMKQLVTLATETFIKNFQHELAFRNSR